MRRVLFASLLTLGVACTGDAGPPVVVMTDERTFDPTTITIEAGDFITWTNESDEPHTVTARKSSIPPQGRYFASGGGDSEEEARGDIAEGLIGSGDDLSVEFDEPGTYEYFCIPHEDQGMKGTIIVEASR